MKILFCIGCFNGVHRGEQTNYDMIYPLTWLHFINKNKDKLPAYDFMFSNGGFEPVGFKKALAPYTKIQEVEPFPPGDQDMTFAAVVAAEGYDYGVRCDQDAFLSVETLNRIATFLESNPVDILSPSGPKQYISPLELQMNRESTWYPWGQPTPGDEIVFMKKSFMDQAYEQFDTLEGLVDPDITEAVRIRPYNLNTLTYRQICDFMGKTSSNPNLNQQVPRIDGQIGTNIFTSMCLLGLKQAEIRDGNRSLENKLKISNYQAGRFKTFAESRDETDSSYQALPGIDAPFFHLGWSYLTSLHFYPLGHPFVDKDLQDSFYHSNFQKPDGTFGMWAAHCGVIKFLCDRHGTQKMKVELQQKIRHLETIIKLNRRKFEQFIEEIEAFYRPAMIDYL